MKLGDYEIVVGKDGKVSINGEEMKYEEAIERLTREGLLTVGQRQRRLGVRACVRCRIRFYVDTDFCPFCHKKTRATVRDKEKGREPVPVKRIMVEIE